MLSRETTGQILRYGLSGAVLALLYSAVYWVCAVRLGISPFAANTLAFLCNLVTGWLFHSRWSFRGRAPRGQPTAVYARFFVINGIGYALNSVWVWIIVYQMGGPVELPIIPIIILTPALGFVLNKFWIFNRVI